MLSIVNSKLSSSTLIKGKVERVSNTITGIFDVVCLVEHG